MISLLLVSLLSVAKPPPVQLLDPPVVSPPSSGISLYRVYFIYKNENQRMQRDVTGKDESDAIETVLRIYNFKVTIIKIVKLKDA